MSFLFAWLGHRDLAASDSEGPQTIDVGPIADAVRERKPTQVVVLSAQEPRRTAKYGGWLRALSGGIEAHVCQTEIRDPWDFAQIYSASAAAIEKQLTTANKQPSLIFHLSPGTGAMSASWIILSKTRFPAELIQSSEKDESTGRFPIKTVSIPFDLHVEWIGDLLRKPGDDLIRLSQSLPPANADFQKIIHKSAAMERVIRKARQVSVFGNVPVLLLGESGTGKELLANAIHTASPRASKPFKAINCGAIPKELIESELFGHVKGAFSGAIRDHPGVFEAARGGTVFLDELGDLPPQAQVRLLRVLQEKQFTPVGATQEESVDVRVISATNRDLHEDVCSDRFRLDLFHRIAVAIIKIPPLRDRTEDIDLLANHVLKTLCAELRPAFSKEPAKLTPSARRRLRGHDWPGNVRELQNTLVRATVWSSSKSISENDLDEALLVSTESENSVLDRPLGDGFDLHALLEGVRYHYLERALRMANGNHTTAAKLVGLTRQTFANWVNTALRSHSAFEGLA